MYVHVCMYADAVWVCILQLQAFRTKQCWLSSPAQGAAAHLRVHLHLPGRQAHQGFHSFSSLTSEFAGVHISTVCKGHQPSQHLGKGTVVDIFFLQAKI